MACIFCDIAAKKIPSNIVHEDEHAIAFHDIAPRAPKHILVIPRRHLDNLDEAQKADAQLLGHLLLLASRVAAEAGLTAGYRVVINRGEDGGETVQHLHVHVLGGRGMAWPPG
ncbi:MAG TPA: histidine triad nucleotide-binding protein [bacterium]|nr:histidine triad nucleotide-binding protein [bacterium]